MKVYTKVVMDWDGNVLEEESYEYDGPVAHAKGGGGDQVVEQRADPWEGVQDYLRGAYGDAERLYQRGGPQYFPGQTYVERDPLENLGQQMQLDYATGALPGQVDTMMDAMNSMLTAPDVGNNPYVQGMMQSSADMLNRNLKEQVMPAIGSSHVASGTYGSSRQGIREGLAMRGTQDAIARENANILGDAYGQGLQAQYRGMAFAPNAMQAGLMPSQLVSQTGEFRRGEQELALQDEMNRYNYEQQSPYTNLSNYMGMLQGAPWNTTSTSSGTGRSGGFSVPGALGGGMMGYAAAPALATAFGLTNPITAPVTIGAALLGGML